ncbi:MAG: hypothetical protein A2V70_18580 [Planctomycetes bacterium RBG_13_63_9]|nr:MAG: hypothetical protein A2V70_18580 [Planctomycetes bacterium RBG_13_63_9]
MRKLQGLFWVAFWVLLSPVAALGQPQPQLRWRPTLESAKEEAAQTDRLVLIHFWADWCHACKTVERQVFSQPQVAAAVHANYVPVKVNADFFPARRQQYGVTALPTDVIVTPDGQLVQKLQGAVAAAEYIGRLNQVAAAARSVAAGPNAQAGAGSASAAAGRVASNQMAAAQPTTSMPPDSDGRYADYYNRRGHAQPAAPQRRAAANPAGPVHPTAPANPSTVANQGGSPSSAVATGPSQAAASMSDNPPLALDGYCPVQLTERAVWAMGNRAWGVRHRGRTYLFFGPEQQRRFLANPDRYAPVLSGNDVVIAIESGKTVPGQRAHGVFFGDRIYLFSNEASLGEFSRAPDGYAERALQITRAGVSTRRPLR